jgi:hypothetical protein
VSFKALQNQQLTGLPAVLHQASNQVANLGASSASSSEVTPGMLKQLAACSPTEQEKTALRALGNPQPEHLLMLEVYGPHARLAMCCPCAVQQSLCPYSLPFASCRFRCLPLTANACHVIYLVRCHAMPGAPGPSSSVNHPSPPPPSLPPSLPADGGHP